MKVLIISHNVISKTSNMGKTMLSYFKDFNVQEIAQFYIHSEVPTDSSLCRNYFRFTDRDALKSLLFSWNRGKAFSERDIQTQRDVAREDLGRLSAVYQYGRKRNAGIYLARNTVWNLAHWKTRKFKDWIRSFSQDIVMFMSGDYAFMYKIAAYAAELAKCPLVVTCVDDFYIHNRNQGSLLGKMVHKSYMKTVCRTMKRASAIFTISDTMNRAYGRMFGIPCKTLHTAAVNRQINIKNDCRKISYLGNVSFNRNEQLAYMGRALKKVEGREPDAIDVYSGEQDPQRCACLTEENGIRFHGSISADEVLKVMENSMAVIHTESFEPDMQAMTRFSVSTKIAESLMYGPCLIAYGPEGIASIDYLKENQAAYVITSPEDLQSGLEEIIGNAELRQQIVANARALAKKNHDASINSANVRRWLEDAIREYRDQIILCEEL